MRIRIRNTACSSWCRKLLEAEQSILAGTSFHATMPRPSPPANLRKTSIRANPLAFGCCDPKPHPPYSLEEGDFQGECSPFMDVRDQGAGYSAKK
jgi:hypothetical protein